MEQEYQFQTEITEAPKPSRFWPTLNKVLTLLLVLAMVAVVVRGVSRGLTPPAAKEAAAKAKTAVASQVAPAKPAAAKPMTMRDLHRREKPMWQKLLSSVTGTKKPAPAARPKKKG